VEGFAYGGVIVSNCDLGVDTYKPADQRIYPWGNNHGSIVEVAGQWYVFYHRMTNGTWFSRQGCIERIGFRPDGSIPQVEMTSQGAGGPLPGHGEYPAHIACVLFQGDGTRASDGADMLPDPDRTPRITQYGADGDTGPAYIASIGDGTVIGFKYVDCAGVADLALTTRGYSQGAFEVRTALDGQPLGRVPVENTNVWTTFRAGVAIPDGIHALYLVYRGPGNANLLSIRFGTAEGG